MKIIEAKHLAYDYVRTDENDKIVETNRALSDLDLEIEEGSFVCILGHNGSGKSTLAKLINGLNLPADGSILVGGRDTRNETELWEIRKDTGMVFQNPDNQIIASVVEEDVGFGPENIGIPTDEIWTRVNQALEAVDMTAYRLRSPNRLSGGQKQRVAIAGTMAMLPRCIVLDEPTAMLDPNGRAEVIRTVRMLNREKGVTIILITHYMEETIDADRIVVMDGGQIVMDGKPREVFTRVEELRRIRMDVPAVTELAWKLRKNGLPIRPDVLSRQELAEELSRVIPEAVKASVKEVHREKPERLAVKDPIMRVRNLTHAYQEGTAMETFALKDVSFEVERGSFTAFIGHTGSGKSTLVQHLNGLLLATGGNIEVLFRDNEGLVQKEKRKGLFRRKKSGSGLSEARLADGYYNIYGEGFSMRALRFKVGLVFQYPEYQLFEVDVLSDVMYGPKNQGLPEAEARSRAEEALRMVGLEEENWKKSPFELSGGQKRRVAIAGVLAMQPEMLILDEPTAGLDPAGREDLFAQIRSLHDKQGMTIVLVSHSMDDVARYADHVIVLENGELKMDGTPEEIFSRYHELEEMGLGAPQMIYCMHDLREAGIRFRTRPDTVEEACEAITELYRQGLKASSGERTEDSGQEKSEKAGKEVGE